MSDNNKEFFIPTSIFDVEKISGCDEDKKRIVWVTVLFGEYRVLQLVKYGVKPIVLNLNRGNDETVDDVNLAYEVYTRVNTALNRRPYQEDEEFEEEEETSDNPVDEIERLVRVAYNTGNFDYMLIAADKANKLLRSGDPYLYYPVYEKQVMDLNLTKKDVEIIEKTGEKIANMLAKLGGRAEAELRKLIFTGYREDTVDTIEGLTDEEKEFLKNILRKPFQRVALIYAYRQVGNIKKLIYRIQQTIYQKYRYKPQEYSDRLPILDAIMA